MQSPLFGGKGPAFASLGAGLRAVALTSHARNAVAAVSIAAVGSVAYVRSYKEAPPKLQGDRCAWVVAGVCLYRKRRCACLRAECMMFVYGVKGPAMCGGTQPSAAWMDVRTWT